MPGLFPRHCARATTALFEEMSQRWRAINNTVSDLTAPRFEPQTFRSRDECATARPTCGNAIVYAAGGLRFKSRGS